MKFASITFQDECADCNEKEITSCFCRKYWGKEVRCNLLITELFHIEMGLLEDGCGHSIFLAIRAVAALWRARTHLLNQIIPSSWSVFCAEGKNDMSKNTQARCVAGWSRMRPGGSANRWSVGATWNSMAVCWWELQKTHTQEPSYISPCSR